MQRRPDALHNLDYSRDFLLKARAYPTTDSVRICAHLKEAQKFILPEGGLLIDDPHLKGIDEKLPLSLPFPVVALEWPDVAPFTKKIVLLRELDTDIELQPLAWDNRVQRWGWQPAVFIERHRYIEREHQDKWATYIRYVTRADKEHGERTQCYIKFLMIFLSFTNALACRNVVTERSPPGAVRKLMQRKSQIPFDEYKILTFTPRGSGSGSGGGASRTGMVHASPREHLRRGHIVRTKHGAYWRSATIVMPGSEGRVEKIYKLAA